MGVLCAIKGSNQTLAHTRKTQRVQKEDEFSTAATSLLLQREAADKFRDTRKILTLL